MNLHAGLAGGGMRLIGLVGAALLVGCNLAPGPDIQRLAEGGRVELRGFGAFSTRAREPRKGRNPRTGEAVDVPAKRVPYFKPGKEMRARLNTD